MLYHCIQTKQKSSFYFKPMQKNVFFLHCIVVFIFFKVYFLSLSLSRSSVFTSLYQQLRGGICPYFYVCTHQFTVLFRCQRFSPKEASLSALLSPSTRGFRELLSKEGYYQTCQYLHPLCSLNHLCQFQFDIHGQKNYPSIFIFIFCFTVII